MICFDCKYSIWRNDEEDGQLTVICGCEKDAEPDDCGQCNAFEKCDEFD